MILPGALSGFWGLACWSEWADWAVVVWAGVRALDEVPRVRQATATDAPATATATAAAAASTLLRLPATFGPGSKGLPGGWGSSDGAVVTSARAG